MVTDVESVTGESLYDYDPNNPEASSRSYSHSYTNHSSYTYRSASNSTTTPIVIRKPSKAATQERQQQLAAAAAAAA